jgi:ACS family glucarate transporter-like MFS transporter
VPVKRGPTLLAAVRYRVLAMLVSLAFITYLDRVCISITAPAMMRDLKLSPMQMSFVFSAFTTTYAIFEIPTGWWGDRRGTRLVLTRIVMWWSCFTGLTAVAWNFSSLAALRALFGMGEAGAWPNVARTLSRWFPARERGTAQGIFFTGAHLGGGVTPFAVAAITAVLPWRAVFPIFGSIGLAWAFVWYRWFRNEPHEHPSVTDAEREWIETQRMISEHGAGGSIARAALRNPSIWFLCLMYFTQTYGFTLYITWLPSYLQREKLVHGLTLSILSGLPLLLSVVADLTGGMTTDSMTRRYGLRVGRCMIGGIALALAGVFLLGGTFAAGTPSGVLIAFAAAFSNFLLGASWGACVDLAGTHAGAVSAAMNTAGQVGGVLSPLVFAALTRNTSSWAMPLVVTAILYLMGAACWLFIHPERSLAKRNEALAT